jgi:hypothetical protein
LQANEEMLDLLLPKPGEGIGSEIAVGKLYASILIQDCFRRSHLAKFFRLILELGKKYPRGLLHTFQK